MININELAEELGVTRQNLNYHILQGRAGEINKDGSNETSRLVIEPHNVITLVKWLAAYGRGNKLRLNDIYKKYNTLTQQSE